MKMELYIVKLLLKSIIARVGFANFSFERTEKRKSRSFGGTDEFLPLFGKDGGRAEDERREREEGEVKGRIVAAAVVKEGEKTGGESAAGVHTQRN